MFGTIPSGRGGNALSIGIGFPNILHGSAQLFYPLNKDIGLGIGASGDWLIFSYVRNYYLQFRFLNNSNISASIFYEMLGIYGGWWTEIDKDMNGFGAGISVKTPFGLLNTNISITSDTQFKLGLISGVEMVQEKGFFFGYSFFRPMAYIGWKGPLGGWL